MAGNMAFTGTKEGIPNPETRLMQTRNSEIVMSQPIRNLQNSRIVWGVKA